MSSRLRLLFRAGAGRVVFRAATNSLAVEISSIFGRASFLLEKISRRRSHLSVQRTLCNVHEAGIECPFSGRFA